MAEKMSPIEMFDEIKKGVQHVLDGEKYKNFLVTASKMFTKKYSTSNIMMIALQKEDASYVCGYGEWKEFGRQVKEGAKSIKILAPKEVNTTLFKKILSDLKNQFKEDPSKQTAFVQFKNKKIGILMQKNGIFELHVNGVSQHRFADEKELKKFLSRSDNSVKDYTVAHVFDVSDTIVPEFLFLKTGFDEADVVLDESGNKIRNRKGEYKVRNSAERQEKFSRNFLKEPEEISEQKKEILLTSLKDISLFFGVPMHVGEIENASIKGYYSRNPDGSDQKIVLNAKNNHTEMITCAFHEMAHAMLHNKEMLKIQKKFFLKELDTNFKELQAESVAFLLSRKFNLPAEQNSFSYLAAWSRGRDLVEIEKSMQYIFQTTTILIEHLEEYLNIRGYDLDLEKIQLLSQADKEFQIDESKSEIESIHESITEFFADPNILLRETEETVKQKIVILNKIKLEEEYFLKNVDKYCASDLISQDKRIDNLREDFSKLRPPEELIEENRKKSRQLAEKER